jgi:hypothetical protein
MKVREGGREREIKNEATTVRDKQREGEIQDIPVRIPKVVVSERVRKTEEKR